MSEFIGSRISLISRSDIRYIGILHEINSENSTVALEQVVSFGTEGRRGDPAKEIPATENVYEYIVFRGSDVKDLRIEEPAKPQPPKPQVPDDPAILQSTARPPTYPPQNVPQYGAPPMHPYYQQNPAARYGYPPYGYPGYPPVGPPGVGQFPPQPPQQQQQPPQQQQQQQQPQPIGGFPRPGPSPQPPIGPAATRTQQNQPQQTQQAIGARGAPQQPPQPQAQQQAVKPAEQQPKPTTPAPQAQAGLSNKPPAPAATQDGKAAAAAPQPVSAPQAKEQPGKPVNNATTGAKARTSIAPALPLAPSPQQTIPALTPASVAPPSANNTTGAPAPKSTADVSDTTAAVQDLAQKVSQLKTSSTAPTNNGDFTTSAAVDRPARQPSNRGRGGFRAGFQPPRKVEIPAGDFDFQSANAKFNKQDLIKEVIASEEVPVPVATNGSTNGAAGTDDENKDNGASVSTDGFYSKKKSFFDNISCENKDRAEAKDGERPRGGAQWRGEETKKNIETFGQGSVDGGMGGNRYMGRGGWRGRGRGNYRGGYRGRGAMRGNAYQ